MFRVYAGQYTGQTPLSPYFQCIAAQTKVLLDQPEGYQSATSHDLGDEKFTIRKVGIPVSPCTGI
jgi:hypothetical protein